MEYQLGDTVVAIGSAMWGDVQPGEIGTVVAFTGHSVGVDWGRVVAAGHECHLGSKVQKGHCTWVKLSSIKHYEENSFDVIVSLEDVI